MKQQSALIWGATIIDSVAEEPLREHAILIENGRIAAVLHKSKVNEISTEGLRVLDASGSYIIPGLMNANVHLLCDVRLESLSRFEGRYHELITEAAQITLRNGLTTVFDTWGPRLPLIEARDSVRKNAVLASSIFCAGNIVGLDGPFSDDFIAKAKPVASPSFVRRVNATWVENVGRRLMWMTPEQVAREVQMYAARGIDFLKYASNDHYPGAFLAFSPRVQRTIVEEARRANLTVQAHSMSVEGLHIAIEAGCDLIQHCNNTGPVEIPEATLRLMAERRVGAVVFPFTAYRLERLMTGKSSKPPQAWKTSDTNIKNLVAAGATVLLATDGALFGADALSDPTFDRWLGPADEGGSLFDLATGHFYWLRAMEEKGVAPMQMLRAATINIARAYGKDADLGSLEAGKVADLVVLAANPLERSENYRSIQFVIKGGQVLDSEALNALPEAPLLSRPPLPKSESEEYYSEFVADGKFPLCPSCAQSHLAGDDGTAH